MAASRFDHDERQILLFTGIAHALTHYVELAFPVLAIVLARETGLPIEQVLGWSLGGYLLFGVGAMPAGFFADRIGGRKLILWGQALASLSAIVAAFCAPGWPIALCLTGMGLGISTYHPAGMGLISRAIRARGEALGINGIYGNVGIAGAPLISALLAESLGWRWTFGITGGVLLVAIFVGASLRFREPAPVLHHEAKASAAGVSRAHIVAFALLSLAAMLGGFAYRGNTLSMPALFQDEIDIMGYGVAAFLAMAIGIGGQYLGGLVADRFPLGWAYVIFHALSLPALLLIPATQNVPLLALASLYVFFALGMQPIENSLFAHLTPERWRSTAYGLKFTLTFGLGSSAVVMVRWVGDGGNFAAVYQFLGGVVGLLVVVAVVLAVVQRNLEEA